MATDPLAAPAELSARVTLPSSVAAEEPVTTVCTPVRLSYTYTPGRALSRYLRAMAVKQILGERCPKTGQVFVPPRGVSPLAGMPTQHVVELPDVGYVESFNVTRVPIERRPDLKPPYCSAWIVLDGASVGFMGLVINIAPEQVRIGMRVRAVWKPEDELEMSAANILGWEPTGEPDIRIDDYARIGRAESDPGTSDSGTTELSSETSDSGTTELRSQTTDSGTTEPRSETAASDLAESDPRVSRAES